MNHLTKVLLSVFTSSICALSLGSRVHAQPLDNIALHKPVTFNTKPNYSLCTDPDDNQQLTDGKYSSEGQLQEVQKTRAIWVQKGTVGWQNRNPVVITIDLGSVQPISGVSFSTAGGTSGVYWPTSIHVAVSDDNKTWHYQGNIVPLSRKNGIPPKTGYAAFRYIDHDLQTKGRYITFGVESVPFVFCDEIEVYRGDDAWLAQPAQGKVIPPMEKFVPGMVITSAAQRRINDDIAAIQNSIETSSLPADRKSTFVDRLNKDADAAAQMEGLPKDFKTILPLNDIHRDVLAVRGELLAAQGSKLLTVWKQHRYAWLELLANPTQNEAAQLNFSMLKDQFRSDNILLTNASGKAEKVTLQLKNAPQNAQENWLQIDSVAWTDTAQGIPVADALLPVSPQGNVYTVDVPAGMTRKIWFTIDSSKIPAGIYKSTFEVNGIGQKISIPLNLDISKVAMKKPRMSLGVWDYTDVPGYGGIPAESRNAAIALMRSHFVDTTWGTRAALPRPGAEAFNAQGDLIAKMDFTNLDQWIAQWPGIRNYFVYLAADSSFAGAKMGTPEFDARVGSWAKVLSAHMKELNLRPQQLGILINDEPHTEAQDAIIANWAKAIKTAAPELTLFEDPTWLRPDRTKNQDAITQIDVLCPNWTIYNQGGTAVQKYFQDMQAQGKKLWIYQCSGPVRLYDPQLYYRYQAWDAFSIGAAGQGFWSFSDTSHAPSSWSEYGTARINYAPAFLDKDAVYNSIHWDSVREGMEDYEELSMLQDAINSSKDATWKSRAEQVLTDAVKAVSVWHSAYAWQQKSNPYLADQQLQNVRSLLDEN